MEFVFNRAEHSNIVNFTDGSSQSAADKAFAEIEAAINKKKSQLDEPYRRFKNASRVGQVLDAFNGLRIHILNYYGGQFVSNGWIKHYEMLQDGILPATPDKPIMAFFNAELPGGFIFAFNHYMAMKDRDFDWRAASYIETTGDNTGLGDTYGILASYPDRWFVGAERADKSGRNMGDMTNLRDIYDVADQVRKVGGCDYYSADAGIDVSADPNNQERYNTILHAGVALCALLSLKVGGTMLTKQYSYFLPINRDLLAVYASLFDKLTIKKPLSSRPGNSEVYIVGTGFKGLTPDAEKYIVSVVNGDVISKRADVDYTDLIDWTRQYADMQMLYIDMNLTLMEYTLSAGEHPNVDKEEIENILRVASNAVKGWIDKCPITRIAADKKIRTKLH